MMRMMVATTTMAVRARDGMLKLSFTPGLPAEHYAAVIDLLKQDQPSCDYLSTILSGIADSWGVECSCERDGKAIAVNSTGGATAFYDQQG
jgi:hypothetical protein